MQNFQRDIRTIPFKQHTEQYFRAENTRIDVKKRIFGVMLYTILPARFTQRQRHDARVQREKVCALYVAAIIAVRSQKCAVDRIRRRLDLLGNVFPFARKS